MLNPSEALGARTALHAAKAKQRVTRGPPIRVRSEQRAAAKKDHLVPGIHSYYCFCCRYRKKVLSPLIYYITPRLDNILHLNRFVFSPTGPPAVTFLRIIISGYSTQQSPT